MSKEMKLIPKLRFPEFDEDGYWSQVPLIETADGNIKWSFTGGPFGSNLKATDYTPNGIRIIQLQNIGDGEFIDDYKISTSEQKADELLSCNIYAGDIILSKMGDPVGRACIIPVDLQRCVMASDGLRLAVNERENSKYFIYSLINSKQIRKRIEKKATGSTRKRIGLNDLKKVRLTLPKSLQEQQKIASCLSSLDELISANKDKLDALKDHKKGLLQNLFPQEGETVPKVRFSEFEEDGEWELKRIEDFFDVGSSKRVLQKDWTTEGVPFYRTRELVSLSKSEPFRSEIFISEDLYLELKESYGIPIYGDFLVSGVGTLGIIYPVKRGDKFYFKDGNVLWFSKRENIDSPYFKFCFESSHIQNQIDAQTSKSTVGTYTIKNARLTEFWHPPTIQEQHKIASCLLAVDEVITAQQEKIEQLQQHKKGLMQGLFPKIED